MKLAFITDTHFDSRFREEDSRTRNGQLVAAFADTVAAARAAGAAAVLLGGDLFDTPSPAPETEAAVRRVFSQHADLPFYAVCGNHDPLGVTPFYADPPQNLYVFKAAPESVPLGEDLSLYGASLADVFDQPDPWQDVKVSGRAILLCHGTVDGRGGFSLKTQTLAATGAALVLLGHIHKTREFPLPGCRILYGGVPWGRGFDECGQKGWYLIDTETMEPVFVPTNAKVYTEYRVDISDVVDAAGLLERLSAVKPQENEIARIVLTGALARPFDFDAQTLCGHLTDIVGIKDETAVDRDCFAAREDNTLEGEFTRVILQRIAQAETEEEKNILTDALKEGVLALRSTYDGHK